MLSGVGVWSMGLRYGDPTQIPAAAEVEDLGYTAIWVPDIGGPTLDAVDVLLGATTSITIATGILSVWTVTPDEVGSWWHGLAQGARRRVLLGVGVSHGPVVGERWERPVATMGAYLDGLETAGVPLNQVCVAALGPRMLELASTRTAGAHPYLVTPQHTAGARHAMGAGALLAVEQGAVLSDDITSARDGARRVVRAYGAMPNYANSWRRLGFTDGDIDATSDSLVDALIACGDEAAVAQRLGDHVRAGADHVCLQILADPKGLTLDAWRRLAPV